MIRTKIPLNYQYDEIRHTNFPINELVDLTNYDYIYVLELHYPYTDIKYLNGLIERMDELTVKGFKVGLLLLGDTLDTPKNGKLRGDYPLLTSKEVIEGFEKDILFKIMPYLKVWILNNHDFEFMEIKDNPTDKVAYNIWKEWIPILRSNGVFITKRVVKSQFRECKAVFEHEHLMPSTVNNRAWKYKNYQYRIFAGNHQAFMLENIYEDDYESHKNIGVPPCVTGLFQYAEERMNPPLLARVLEIDQTKKPIELREIT